MIVSALTRAAPAESLLIIVGMSISAQSARGKRLAPAASFLSYQTSAIPPIQAVMERLLRGRLGQELLDNRPVGSFKRTPGKVSGRLDRTSLAGGNKPKSLQTLPWLRVERSHAAGKPAYAADCRMTSSNLMST